MRMEKRVEYRRGDILWIQCQPSIGVEPRKVRTCVVVSNDVANEFGQGVTVVPTQGFTTERMRRAYMVDLRRPRSNLEAARLANCSMVMTYDRRRVVKRAGSISEATHEAVDRALSIHLGLAVG